MHEKKKERKLNDLRNGMVKRLLDECQKGTAPPTIQKIHDDLWANIKAEVIKSVERIVLLPETDER